MVKELTRLANHLDAKGLRREASYIDNIIKKIADGGVDTDADKDVGEFTREMIEEMYVVRRPEPQVFQILILRPLLSGAESWDEYIARNDHASSDKDRASGQDVRDAWAKAAGTGRVVDEDGIPYEGSDYWGFVAWYNEEAGDRHFSKEEAINKLSDIYLAEPKEESKYPSKKQCPPGDLQCLEKQRQVGGPTGQ